MLVESCIPVIPSADLEKSLRAVSPIRPEDYHGISLYWAPEDIREVRDRLLQLGYSVSEIVARDYGQTEFSVTDDDGYSHTFGVATNNSGV